MLAAPAPAANCTPVGNGLSECSAPAQLAHTPLHVTTARLANAAVNVERRFRRGSVTRACLDFTFGDPLEPGEDMSISLSRRSAGGFANPGSTDQPRTFCWAPGYHDEILSHFTDGREHIEMWMRTGSVTIESLTLRITGPPRPAS